MSGNLTGSTPVSHTKNDSRLDSSIGKPIKLSRNVLIFYPHCSAIAIAIPVYVIDLYFHLFLLGGKGKCRKCVGDANLPLESQRHANSLGCGSPMSPVRCLPQYKGTNSPAYNKRLIPFGAASIGCHFIILHPRILSDQPICVSMDLRFLSHCSKDDQRMLNFYAFQHVHHMFSD
jgi:hypothetical protein